MPLLHILGQTPLAKNFTVAFCFLSREDHESYQWAIEQLKSFAGWLKPLCLLTDCELALKNALANQFPQVPQIICTWHIEKNVLTHAQKVWAINPADSETVRQETEQLRKDFMAAWTDIVYALTLSEFAAKWDALQTKYRDQTALCAYLCNQWYPFRHQWAKAYLSNITHFGYR